jgi:hypothetical protein
MYTRSVQARSRIHGFRLSPDDGWGLTVRWHLSSFLEDDPHIGQPRISSAPIRLCFHGFTVMKLPPPANAIGRRSWSVK